jgi:hypothetical protein
MMKNIASRLLRVALLTSILISSAEVSRSALKEEVLKIKKLAVATSLSGQGTDVSHHGGLTLNPYAKIFGVLGILIGSGAERVAIQSSLEKYSDTLKDGLADYSPKVVFDRAFERLFVMSFETVSPTEVEKTVSNKQDEKDAHQDAKKRDYALLRDRLGVDSVLEVDFVYGLEVHGKSLAASVITADIRLVRLDDNAILLNKQITSGNFVKTWYNVNDFMKNNAEIYKQEFSKASEAIVYLAGLELGVNLGSSGNFYWQQENKAETTK